MNWNWKWKAAATGATALAGWLASPPLQSPAARPGSAAVEVSDGRAAAQDAAVSDIEQQAVRLASRVSPPAAPAVPSRNLFRFRPKALQPRPSARQAVEAVQPPARTPFPFRLTGVAVDIVDGAPKRTAILSGPLGLALAQRGEMAADDYRVTAVDDDTVDITRLSDGAHERLTLTP